MRRHLHIFTLFSESEKTPHALSYHMRAYPEPLFDSQPKILLHYFPDSLPLTRFVIIGQFQDLL
jgi:hypothetical protein